MRLNNRIILGLAAGAAIGGGLTYLYSTKNGSRLRQYIKQSGRETASDLLDLIEAGVERSADIWYKSQAANSDLSDSIESLKKRIRR